MGCWGFSKSSKNRKIAHAKNKKGKRSDDDASVWPLPAAAAAATAPDRSPIHVRRVSSIRKPHPLPAPTDFSSRGRSPPQPLPPVPSISSSWSARSSRLLRRFDFERLARLCNHFAPRSQLRESVYRCYLEQEEMAVDVLSFRSTASEEEWIEQLNRLALLEHRNVCRIVGFSSANSLRLVVFEASDTSSSVNELLLLPSDHNRARVQKLDFNWDARLQIALAAAQGLAFLHQSSPLQAARFGTSNVLVDKISDSKSSKKIGTKGAHDVKLQLMLAQESCEEVKASNITDYGIFLLELLSGKTNMERLLHADHGRSQGLFVQWARGVVNDSGKLGSILDPRLLLHCNPLSAARDLANFALSCLHADPRLRPRMQQAASLIQSLIAMRELQQSRRITARTPSSSASQAATLPSSTNQQHQFLGRSATFSHQETGRRRDLTPPPRTSADLDDRHWRAHAPRSAGASPARYTTSYY